MARFDAAFDASGIEPTTAYELLPAGKYSAQIVESEMRVTRNGMGQFLWLMLDILDGPHKGRKIFDQLNLVKIRTQIATADLARQRGQKPIDPDWFHRARTALRHLCRERAELLAKGTGRRRREKLKDALIGVLRDRHDPETWDGILAEAQARSEREGL